MVMYTAKAGTLSELVTAGDQFNQQHITGGVRKETQTPADELAASRTARAAVFIRNDPARPTQTGELVGMLPAPKGKRFTMTEQQTLLSHGVATAHVESGYCAFSVMSPRTGKTLTGLRITVTSTVRRCIPARMYCAN